MKTFAALLSAVALAGAAHATGPNLVTNGGFESLTATAAQGQYHLCDNTQPGCVSALTGWTATAGAGGSSGTNTPGSVLLGGNGGAEWNSGFGLYGPIPNSPAGGNFIGIDGDPGYTQTVSQTINGLAPGQQYVVSFYQAAGQQQGLSGATTEQWQVSLGAETHVSTNQFNASQSFLPWTPQSLTFTAAATSEALTFLAIGTPSGEPPIALLDGVSLNAVPEPATWALMLVGFGLTGALVRRRNTRALAV